MENSDRSRRRAWASVLCAAAMLAPQALQAGEIRTVELAFQQQAMDLSSGVVIDAMDPAADTAGDIRLAYNALRLTKAVVVPIAGTEMALFEGLAFDGVSAELAADLVFSPEPIDVAFSADVTVVIRTAGGAVFKLGNTVESATGVTFNYAAL